MIFPILNDTERVNYRYSAMMAGDWLTEFAIKDEKDIAPDANLRGLAHTYWKGAVRGEYSFSKNIWSFFCPIWHGGQAIKALVMLYRLSEEDKYLTGALRAAEFIVHNTDIDRSSEDFGLIYGYEDIGDQVNISAVLECIDGLFHLGEALADSRINISDEGKEILNRIKDYDPDGFKNGTGFGKYFINMGVNAASWVVEKAALPGGIIAERYDPKEGVFYGGGVGERRYKGRPLADDAVFLKAFRYGGSKKLKEVFYAILERLIKDEDPPGNWIIYGPCNREKGYIHPRHAYWWGLPFLDAYEDTHNIKYLRVAIRSALWYSRAMRTDGGIFRNTYIDFNTDSFGHATSGSACAVILMDRVLATIVKNVSNELPSDLMEFIEKKSGLLKRKIRKGLEFCQKMQLRMPEREEFYGMVLEKVLPPDGTGRNPYYVRDLGTIFYIQACCTVLELDRLLNSSESLK